MIIDRIKKYINIQNGLNSDNKEITMHEFIDFLLQCKRNCNHSKCVLCVLNGDNTKCRKNLCKIEYWKEYEEELYNIVKSGKTIIEINEKQVIEILEKFHCLTDKETEAINFILDKLKKENKL